MVAPGKTEARLDLGDLGAADRNAVRLWPVKLDHGAVAFLAYENDMRHRHDMAAVHPDEQSGIELRLGFGNRPDVRGSPAEASSWGRGCGRRRGGGLRRPESRAV